jgi:HEAT repeat protein
MIISTLEPGRSRLGIAESAVGFLLRSATAAGIVALLVPAIVVAQPADAAPASEPVEVTEAVDALRTGGAPQRAGAIRRLAELGRLDLVRLGLDDATATVRAATIEELSRFGADVFAAGIDPHAWIHDTSPSVREAAATTIAELARFADDPAAAVTAIIALADTDADGAVQLAAVSAIGRLGPTAGRTAVPWLVTLLTSGNADAGRIERAATALGELGIGGEPAIAALAGRTTHDETGVRRAACEAIGRFGADGIAALPALRARIDDGTESVAVAAVGALGDIATAAGDAQRTGVVTAIVDGLVHGRSGTRRAAAEAIVRVAGLPVDHRLIERIARTGLVDSLPDVRATIASALVIIGPAAVLPVIALAEDRETDAAIRATALRVLGRIGPRAGDRLDAAMLVAALSDADAGVRRAAADALVDLGPATSAHSGELAQTLMRAVDADAGSPPAEAATAAARVIGRLAMADAAPLIALSVLVSARTGSEADPLAAAAAEALWRVLQAQRPALDRPADAAATHARAQAIAAIRDGLATACAAGIDPATRTWAILALGELVAPPGADVEAEAGLFAAAIRDGDNGIRVAAERAVARRLAAGLRLGGTGWPAATLALLDDPATRASGVTIVAGVGDAAVPAFTEPLADPATPPAVAAGILAAFARIGGHAVVAPARAAADHDAAIVRRAALRVLGGAAAIDAVSVATGVTGLADADSEVRTLAAWLLGRAGAGFADTAAGPLAAVLSGDSAASVREESAQALGRLGPAGPAASDRVLPALLAATGDADGHVRRESALALSRLGAPGIFALTGRLISAAAPADRRAAAAALGEIGPAAVTLAAAAGADVPGVTPLDALVSALADADWRVRRAAATALGNLETAAVRAQRALRARQAADPHPNVREAAERALADIAAATARAAAAAD